MGYDSREKTPTTTKVEVVGTCVKVVEPDATSRFPKLEVWVEYEDGQYKGLLPFEAGEKYAAKFVPRPQLGDIVRASGYVSGRAAKDGSRVYLSIRLAFMRVEGTVMPRSRAESHDANAPEQPQRVSDGVPPPTPDIPEPDLPF
jgi:hypothetical protein